MKKNEKKNFCKRLLYLWGKWSTETEDKCRAQRTVGTETIASHVRLMKNMTDASLYNVCCLPKIIIKS